jgi:hypothetical protein
LETAGLNPGGAWVVAVSLGPIQADSTLPDGHLDNRPVILLNQFRGDGTMDVDKPDEEEDDARGIHG